MNRQDDARAAAIACMDLLHDYRTAATGRGASVALAARARGAFLYLGGDPARSAASLKDYDHLRYGPFLGVSDEGSAAAAIRGAAFDSPKVRALPESVEPDPLTVGVALDAERLGGVGEVAVGPDEYADIWLACVDRLLVTTNIGTRVNLRTYRAAPRVAVTSGRADALVEAKERIAAAFEPFVDTPDRTPRPLTVFIEFPAAARMTVAQKRTVLKQLAGFVASGRAAGKDAAPEGHALGLASVVGAGPRGRDASIAAIDLAARAGLHVVMIDGVKSRKAERLISRGGLLDYFEPGIVGPLLRHASAKRVRLRTANLPDTDTIARSVWVGLHTARSMGANLGKYGCFPLTLPEIDEVVRQIQQWLGDWSAAPVFFVDQGLLSDRSVDVERDLMRGISTWLKAVAAHGVRVVLIDTVDKPSGRRLLKKSSKDREGYLGLEQLERVEREARELGIKVLWAGGLGLRECYALGRTGVFGVYVTTAAATTIPAGGVYTRDPALAGVKEPSREAVLRTKVLLEAGFLAGRLRGELSHRIEHGATELLSATEAGDPAAASACTAALAAACTTGWQSYWKTLD